MRKVARTSIRKVILAIILSPLYYLRALSNTYIEVSRSSYSFLYTYYIL